MTEQELERALSRALQPVDPGEDFSERVVKRLDTTATERSDGAAKIYSLYRPARRRSLFSRWAPVALAACAMAAIGLMRWEQRGLERQRGLQARAQLLQALSIASAKVNAARAAVIREEERLN